MVGFVLSIVQPFSFLADVVPVFPVGAFGSLHMDTVETTVDGFILDGISGSHVQVGVGCSLFAGFITHTPVVQTGELIQDGADALMGVSVGLGVVEGQLEFAGCLFTSH